MIKLTGRNNQIYINPREVSSLYPGNGGAIISMTNGETFMVTEGAEEIATLCTYYLED